MNNGWIKLHRSLLYNEIWIQKPYSKGQAWVDLLLRTNHSDNEIIFNGDKIQIEKGSFITSILKLSECWGWSRNKVDSFLHLLERCSMIRYKKDTKKTHITICNYTTYQDVPTEKEHKKDIKKTTEGHQKDINKNEEELKNEKEIQQSEKTDCLVKDYIDLIIDIFVEEYNYIRGENHIITNHGKNRAAVFKLNTIFKSKYPDLKTEEMLIKYKSYFRKCLQITEDWHYNNMSIPHILNKFNEINMILKGKPKTTFTPVETFNEDTKEYLRSQGMDVR